MGRKEERYYSENDKQKCCRFLGAADQKWFPVCNLIFIFSLETTFMMLMPGSVAKDGNGVGNMQSK